ncbi:Sporulation protein YlmC, PRC-barrel domain family [Catalinimonas alkaloidigena]|uniref:Sporulation protein YlmC, PRC-barrel domain family n=1 Tax=Catalinimonas alkaloidigena TaxID=1075417 RepID=A0A1G9EGK4_9BACT|nr:PRC-barrel domain-containing protein [Catalinimonas alkaloidigena]SDK75272.1 Sporulation protein YlmC, PRC-barrel domain family [Catalinimonas alkaloidigena]
MNNNLTLSATSIVGTKVVNNQNENLGDIKDLMIDTNRGRIAYAVLSFGGFLGMGDKLFAIPWPMIKFDTVDEHVVLDVSKEQLENAPGFDKDNWPNEPQNDFVNRVYSHYGYNSFYNNDDRNLQSESSMSSNMNRTTADSAMSNLNRSGGSNIGGTGRANEDLNRQNMEEGRMEQNRSELRSGRIEEQRGANDPERRSRTGRDPYTGGTDL